MQNKLQQIKDQVAILEKEVNTLSEKGIKAAAPRARKAAQEIKNLCHSFRDEITQFKNEL